ncbi:MULTISPECIES: hypothetical protein [Paraburkholderia]|nr:MULTISPECIES: hypothetical protein [Paraburkholderia]MCX4154963.1 hypothetical protein [Paraburkholderia aspalathi]MDN7164374.1 hypothetical protein [Paraburkholderia sp. SECH2]MDQ6392859.1 hypothetical protein [Paraburkholderia aspalathi]
MSHHYPHNDLLAATYVGLGLFAKICACFAAGVAIGGVWYLCAALRAGAL